MGKGTSQRPPKNPPPVQPTPRTLWDQRPGEPADAYIAFMRYRDLGHDGTLLKAYQEAGHPGAQFPSGQWTGWSSTWSWEIRRDAYWVWVRQTLSAVALQEMAEEVKTTAVRQLKVVRTIQSKGVTGLNNVSDLNPEQTLRFLTTGLELERRLLKMDAPPSLTVQVGQPEDTSGVYAKDAPNNRWVLLAAQLESMSVEELREYRKLLIQRLKSFGGQNGS